MVAWSRVIGPLVLASVALACGPAPVAVHEAEGAARGIIGGSISQPSDYPAVGVTLTKGEVDGYAVGGMVCSGTLIAPDVVLTAAHCTDLTELVYDYRGTNVENYFTLATDVVSFYGTLEPPPDAVAIRAMVPHPSWDLDAFYNFEGGLADFKDIALVFLDARIESVAPAVVLEADDTSALAVGEEVVIVGYGQSSVDEGVGAAIKRHAVTFINELGPAEMQIGDLPPEDPGKCYGDSGGPTFMTMSDGKEPGLRVIGVTSHVYDDTRCERGGVDTRVDSYRIWIDNAMRAACGNGQRLACADEGGLPEPRLPGVSDAGAGDQGWYDAGAGRDLVHGDLWRAPVDGSRSPSAMPREADDPGCGCQAVVVPRALTVPLGFVVVPLVLLGTARRRSCSSRTGCGLFC